MYLRKLFLTQNACYISNRKITVKGIMVHSTGADNPNLKRYVGPDDGLLGKNMYNNHWNTYRPDGREVCPHAFIGKLADGRIAVYQTLPWNHRGWHAGGEANNTHIGFEICEDSLKDSSYFSKVYKEAVELCVYLCKQYSLSEKNIICHSEGHSMGLASNHSDVMHWFPKHGKSMETFRSDVRKLLAQPEKTESAIRVGNRVAFNKNTSVYYPGGPSVPAWVIDDYYHIVTLTTFNGKPVIMGGKNCVLLGKKVKKNGTDIEAGINTWTAADSLTGISAKETLYTVKEGDTLWNIALEKLGNGLLYKKIMQLNELDDDIIYVGQKLRLPE